MDEITFPGSTTGAPSSAGREFDVIVIGARVAGAVLAGTLGQMGYRVLVIDRAKFPSDTLSTHFFRDPTFRALERIGVLEQVKALAPALAVSHNVVDTFEFDEPVRAGSDASFALCVRRIRLDDILVQRLKSIPSVTLREGAAVHEFHSDGRRLVGVRWLEDGGSAVATARAIVGADGVRSTLASHVHPEIERGQKVQRLMYYAYFSGFEGQREPAAEFHYRGNSLAYVFPTSDELTLVALSLPISEFVEFKKDAARRFMKSVRGHPKVAPRLDRAVLASHVAGSGSIPSYQRVPYGPGWALVGDAGQVLDPWTGQGIDQASTHALLLAEALDNYLSDATSWETAMAQYHHRRNAFSMKAYERTTTHAADFRPMTRAALVRRGLA